jgi:predicted dehydrogenase
MKALIVGYGSIGTRHARILAELGCHISVISSRLVPVDPLYKNISEAVRKESPDYIVVASETSRHFDDLAEITACDYKGLLLVEKPLFHTVASAVGEIWSNAFVAYNLRFHPLIARLRELLANERIVTVEAYVGQYLPDWRPDRDYREAYSASLQAGGGVLRDLSHELDLLNWLLGGWRTLSALGGKHSSLEITSDDSWAILMATARCPVVSLQLNYLDRPGRRSMLFNTDAHTFELDFVSGVLKIDGKVEEYRAERDYTYGEMHRALLRGDAGNVCTFAEGIEVVATIDAVERAAAEGAWVAR